MFERFLEYSDTLVPLFSLVAYIRPYKLRKQEKFLLSYVFLSVAVFGVSNYMADRGINNMFLYHGFSLFELLIVLYYASFFFVNKKVKSFLLIIGIAYIIYWLTNIFIWESLKEFNSNAAGIAYLIIIIVCGLYFLSLSDKEELLYFQRLPQFWVMTGFLFYCTCSIPIMLSYKYHEIFYDLDQNTAWKIQVVANFIKFAAISYAAICSYKYQDGSL
ncbi:MAG: hypothetical protein ACTHOF_13990 [Flavisolibacter sp.]|jgi:hypothetical protein